MKRICPFLMALVLVACATTNSIKKTPVGRAKERTYSVNPNIVLKAVQDSIFDTGMWIRESKKTAEGNWRIIAEKDASAWSWGELVRVDISESARGAVVGGTVGGIAGTVVRIYTKRKMATNITAKGDWSEEIFAGIEKRLR